MMDVFKLGYKTILGTLVRLCDNLKLQIFFIHSKVIRTIW